MAHVAFPAFQARSYDGNDWESVHPILIQTSCDDQGACSVQLPPEDCDGIHYVIESHAPEASSPEQEAAKLLEQGTFGITRGSIDDLLTTTAEEWIREQMDEPPSLHRVHYRQRSNSHVSVPSCSERCVITTTLLSEEWPWFILYLSTGAPNA